MSTEVHSSYESPFANPAGIAVFGNHIYVSDPARETISRVDLDMSSELVMERNMKQPDVLKVYPASLIGQQTGIFTLILT